MIVHYARANTFITTRVEQNPPKNRKPFSARWCYKMLLRDYKYRRPLHMYMKVCLKELENHAIVPYFIDLKEIFSVLCKTDYASLKHLYFLFYLSLCYYLLLFTILEAKAFYNKLSNAQIVLVENQIKFRSF